MLTNEQVMQIPFRDNKYNVAPDDKLCQECGKCCKRYGYIVLLPVDFKLKNFRDEMRIMKELGILGLSWYPHKGATLWIGEKDMTCPILGEHGCRLSQDTRPVACGHFKPILNKAGRRNCKAERSDWLNELPEEMVKWSDEQISFIESLMVKN
jgi:Fe-S-cluster containining protein